MTRVMLVAIAILALGGGLVAACVLQVRNAKAETEATIGNEAETTSQQREQQRLHAQKLESLGFLASRIAHDLNNILAGIMGYADLALAELPAADPVHLHIEVIKKAVRRATELTRQVLAYSGNERLSVEPVNLTRTVKELSRLLEVSIPKNAALKHDFAAELPEIQANASQIHQLIMNLVLNAAEALGDMGGAISISTGTVQCNAEDVANIGPCHNLAEGLYVRLEVADTGCGMDQQTLTQIFDPHFTTKSSGSGMGLAAAQSIVRNHMGAIRVSSERGKGTVFQVMFPASGLAPAPVASNSTTPSA